MFYCTTHNFVVIYCSLDISAIFIWHQSVQITHVISNLSCCSRDTSIHRADCVNNCNNCIAVDNVIYALKHKKNKGIFYKKIFLILGHYLLAANNNIESIISG